jgi:hypothetical protein
MNPKKCAFSVSAGQFLGFLVHEGGMEIGLKSQEGVKTMVPPTDIEALSVRAWAMYFDGSACGDGCGIEILLVSPRGAAYSFSIRLPIPCTNNLA